MKYTLFGGLLASLSVCALSAQTTLTVDNFSYRSNGVFGAPSEGLIDIDPDASFVAPGGGSPTTDIPLRWSGLDLNGDSTADDYINFTLRVSGNQGNVVISNQGIGLKSGADSINDNLNPGEELIVEIINPVLSPSVTAGAATFDGFTQAALGGGGISPGTEATVGQTNVDINGVPIIISVNDAFQEGEGTTYRYTQFPQADFSLQSSVYFKDLTTIAIGDPETVSGFEDTVSILLSNTARIFDFQISYDPEGTPVTPPVCFTADNLNFRANGSFINPAFGGSNVGDIVTQPGYTPPPVIGKSFDIPLRWQDIDLDGVGTDDDYFDFILRVTDTSGNGARISGGNGFGVNGGSSWGIDGNEGLFVEVLYPELSAGVPGAMEFAGFSEVAIFGVAGSGEEGTPTQATASLDVNGTTVTTNIDGIDYSNATSRLSFFPTSAENLLFTNPVLTNITEDPLVFAREFDLKFNYLAEGTPEVVPSKCVTTSGLNLRKNATFYYGTTSEGLLEAQPGFDPTAVANSPNLDLLVRWSGLDLDENAAFDEYIDFTLRFSSLDGSPVNFSGSGLGVDSPDDLNWGLDSLNVPEGVVVQVLYPEAGPNTPGGVQFEGFTQGGIIVEGNAGAGVVTTGSASVDVNGVTITGTLPNVNSGDGGEGYENDQPVTSVLPISQTLTFDNPVITDGSASPTARIRYYDLKFSYSADFDDNIGAPDACFTVTDLNLRNNATYVFNGTQTSDGSTVEAAPGFDGTMIVAGPSVDLPLRWNFLDLDGIGSFDDYVDFTVRATSGTADNVIVTGEGIGIAGNGTNALDPGETLTLEIVSATASTGGLVDFTFTTGKLFASGNAGEGVVTDGSASGSINGSTISLTLPNPNSGDGGEAYENVAAATAIVPGSSTLVAGDAILTLGSITPALRLRDFSITMCYTASDVTPGGAPEITLCGFVDSDTFFIEFSPGGTGYKVTTPTSGGLDFAGGATDVTTSLAPSGAGDSRFEFDITGGASFFRVEEE